MFKNAEYVLSITKTKKKYLGLETQMRLEPRSSCVGLLLVGVRRCGFRTHS
jgi:hypothetical protein